MLQTTNLEAMTVKKIAPSEELIIKHTIDYP